MIYRLWTESEIQTLKSGWWGASKSSITSLFPTRTWSGIGMKARRLGLRRDTSKLSRNSFLMGNKCSVKYSYNKKYFDSITNESCYWAGFIAADGYIRTKPQQMSVIVVLSEKDKNQLYKFSEAVAFTGKILEYKSGPYRSAFLGFHGASEIIEGLKNNFNVTHNKSKYLPPPNLIEESHIISYMVGFIDGDGCIDTYKSGKYNYLRLGLICSCSEILEWFKYWFDLWSHTNRLNPAVVTKGRSGNWYNYGVGGSRAEAVLQKLNSIELPRMERKWERLVKFSRGG